jgi:phosphotransferase system  glucose/maltose/N-acetylglucosamine-specific IIC component
MKRIIAKLISVAPVIIVTFILAYILEEILEDFYSEAISDFVYPIAALVALGILWYRVMPTVQAYLNEDSTPSTTDHMSRE